MEPPHTDEPAEIRRLLESLLHAAGRRRYIVFTGNRLPRYLWSAWGETLKRRGYQWQDLLRALSLTTGDVLDWVEGRLSWDELQERVWRAITSLQPRAQRRGKPRTRRLDEYF